MTEIRAQAELVHRLRLASAIVQEELRRREEAFRTENATLIGQVDACRQDLQIAEARLRQLALTAYVERGEKRPGPGVSIRLMTKLCYDPAAALVWAKRHDMALMLDLKAFERHAKAGDVPGVVVEQEPTAVIATDLAKALGETMAI